MTTVYVVTEGRYSDYGIRGVFDTRENAERAIPLFDSDDTRIEEYELNAVLSLADQGLAAWAVGFVGQSADVHYVNGPSPVPNADEFELADNNKYRPSVLWVYVAARDKEHAIKVANEKRAQYWANNPAPQGD